MPSAPVNVMPCVPRMMTPALALSGHSRATTRARAVARRRDCGVRSRTIFGALGLLLLFPARETVRGPRREQVRARVARRKLTLILYIGLGIYFVTKSL